MYSPAQFSKMIGKSVPTLQRCDREGRFIAHRNSKSRRYYTHDQYLEYIGAKASDEKGRIVVYSRVSSSSQKNDLKNQTSSLEIFCAAHGYAVDFGFDWFESFAERHVCSVIVMNTPSLSPAEEVTQDFLSIIHCFSSRFYGSRKYKDKVFSIIRTEETT